MYRSIPRIIFARRALFLTSSSSRSTFSNLSSSTRNFTSTIIIRDGEKEQSRSEANGIEGVSESKDRQQKGDSSVMEGMQNLLKSGSEMIVEGANNLSVSASPAAASDTSEAAKAKPSALENAVPPETASSSTIPSGSPSIPSDHPTESTPLSAEKTSPVQIFSDTASSPADDLSPNTSTSGPSKTPSSVIKPSPSLIVDDLFSKPKESFIPSDLSSSSGSNGSDSLSSPSTSTSLSSSDPSPEPLNPETADSDNPFSKVLNMLPFQIPPAPPRASSRFKSKSGEARRFPGKNTGKIPFQDREVGHSKSGSMLSDIKRILSGGDGEDRVAEQQGMGMSALRTVGERRGQERGYGVSDGQQQSYDGSGSRFRGSSAEEFGMIDDRDDRRDFFGSLKRVDRSSKEAWKSRGHSTDQSEADKFERQTVETRSDSSRSERERYQRDNQELWRTQAEVRDHGQQEMKGSSNGDAVEALERLNPDQLKNALLTILGREGKAESSGGEAAPRRGEPASKRTLLRVDGDAQNFSSRGTMLGERRKGSIGRKDKMPSDTVTSQVYIGSDRSVKNDRGNEVATLEKGSARKLRRGSREPIRETATDAHVKVKEAKPFMTSTARDLSSASPPAQRQQQGHANSAVDNDSGKAAGLRRKTAGSPKPSSTATPTTRAQNKFNESLAAHLKTSTEQISKSDLDSLTLDGEIERFRIDYGESYVAFYDEGVLFGKIFPESAANYQQIDSLSNVWLRDNCQCASCVQSSTGQKLGKSSDFGDLDVKSIAKSAGESKDLDNEVVDLGRQSRGSCIESAEAKEVDGSSGISVVWAASTYQQRIVSQDMKIVTISKEVPSHESFYSDAFLRKHLMSANSHKQVPAITWSRADLLKAPTLRIDYKDFVDSDEGLLSALLQLATYGIVVLKGVPTDRTSNEDCELRKAMNRIGELRNTFYGETWDVKAVKDSKNIAYTNVDLGLHQDLLYFESPPRYQALHCLRNRVNGGASYFVDAEEAARIMYRIAPVDFAVLCERPVPFHYDNDGYHYWHTHPTFELVERQNHPVLFSNHRMDPSQIDQIVNLPPPRLHAVNYSPPFQAPQSDRAIRSTRKNLMLLNALQLYDQILSMDHLRYEFTMEEGDLVLFDNRRILHARREFSDKPGTSADVGEGEATRWLKGCYLDGDVIRNKQRVLLRKMFNGEIQRPAAWGSYLEKPIGMNRHGLKAAAMTVKAASAAFAQAEQGRGGEGEKEIAAVL